MNKLNTISNWLKNRYQLIIRNEDNFAEKHTFSFTYAKLIVSLVILTSCFLGISLFLATGILSSWLDPRIDEEKRILQLHELQYSIDSITQVLDNEKKSMKTLQAIIQGKDPGELYDQPPSKKIPENELNQPVNLKPDHSDSLFRSEMVNAGLINTPMPRSIEETDTNELNFFFPITGGIISAPFDQSASHYGIDIVTAKNKSVKSISDGTIIFSDFQIENGFVLIVQHANMFISVYKHNASLIKKVGESVNTGDVIAVVGDTGTLSEGPHLHFELWFNGKPVNPLDFIPQ